MKANWDVKSVIIYHPNNSTEVYEIGVKYPIDSRLVECMGIYLMASNIVFILFEDGSVIHIYGLPYTINGKLNGITVKEVVEGMKDE